MRNKDLAGKEALRVEVFMPEMNPADERRAKKYIGTQFDLSLIFRHHGVHEMPGPDREIRVCYELYMHDEVTPGGILIADSCQLPEYYLDAVSLDPVEEIMTLTMNNGYEFTVDFTEMLKKYDTMVRRDAGQGTMTFVKNDIDVISWVEGATYTLNSEDNTLTIHAADGNNYVVTMTDWDFDYDDTTSVFSITKNGVSYLQFMVGAGGGGGSLVTFEDNGNHTYTISVNGAETTFPGYDVAYSEDTIGNRTITINGTDHTFNTGVSLVENLGDGYFKATNADANEVIWFGTEITGELILNNPTIYIRQATGSASPAIEDQSDLTEGNAFNSFSSALTFLQNTVVVGNITFDARGTFSYFILSDATAKSSNIVVQGDPSAPEDLVFTAVLSGANAGRGFTADVATIEIKDCTWDLSHSASFIGNMVASPLRVRQGAIVSLTGTHRFTGTHNRDAIANASSCCFWYVTGNATLTLQGRISMVFDVGAVLSINNICRVESGSVTIVDGFVAEINQTFKTSNGWFALSSTTALTMTFTSSGAPVITGTFTSTLGRALQLAYISRFSYGTSVADMMTVFDWHVRNHSDNAMIYPFAYNGAAINDVGYNI